ncbi:hypothetical protein [Streptomyces syringium]|uniref:hypothetical protein n=1 Tax=Streptomyces syringium TaxID=76729 RepID=UPI003443E03E
MLNRILIWAAWFVILCGVNAYLLEASWAQLVFTGVSTAVMLYIQDKVCSRTETDGR